MKKLLTLLVGWVMTISAFAQSLQPFPSHYYYQDTKVSLDFATDKLLIKFNANTTETQQREVLSKLHIVVASINQLPNPEVSIITLTKAVDAYALPQLLETLNKEGKVKYASPFYLYRGDYQTLTKEFIVRLHYPADYNTLVQMAAASGATIKEANPFINGLYTLEAQGSNNAMALANLFHESNLFAYSEPNFLRFMKKTTTDPMYATQWSIKNLGAATYPGGTAGADMNVSNAWGITTGSPNIKVAVIDEGVDLVHPDLVNNLLAGYDATGAGSAGNATNNDAHGTACAGIIAAQANNNIGMAGVAYNCKIIPVRIAYDDGSGGWTTSNTWIGNAITWAWQTAGADVLSNSWGGGSPSTTISNAFNDAVNLGRNGLGSPVLVAAGNGNGAVGYPATLSDVIAVAAMSMCNERKNPNSCDGETWWGSDYGAELDVAAPGVKIVATDISGTAGYSSGDYTSTFNGTSSATPNAAGVMALILSANPALSQTQARSILETTCSKVGNYSYTNTAGHNSGTWNNEMGYGRINALAAVNLAIGGCLMPTNVQATNNTNSVTVNWTSTVGLYNIEYGTTGFTLGTGTTINGLTANSLTLTGLNSATTFDCYIQANCGGGDYSPWTSVTFSTPCNSFVAPFTEDWEGASLTCWTQSTSDNFDWTHNYGATASLSTGPDADHSGTYYMYIETSSPRVVGEKAQLSSAPINVSALTNPELSFWYHMYGATIGTLNVAVEYPYGSGNYTNVWTLSGDKGNVWTKATVSLATYIGQTIGLRFEGIVGSSYTGDIAIGDVTIANGLVVTCPPPSAFSINNVTNTSITLNWTSTAPLVNIEYGISNFTQGSGSVINGAVNSSMTISGLTIGQTYDFYIQSNCGTGNTSTWVGPVSVTVPMTGSIILGGSTVPSLTSEASPINIWYRSLRYQTIYTAAELTAAGATAGNITHLGWNVETAPLYALPNYTISMKNTVATDVAAHDGTGLTPVYTNTLYSPTAGGFDMLSFQTPFPWDGVSNILVDVCFAPVSPTFNASGQVKTYAETSSARYIRNDASSQCGATTATAINRKPQVQLVIISPCAAPTATTVSNITNTMAVLNWTSTATSFNIDIGLSGYIKGNGTTINGVTNNQYTLVGLNAATSYDFYLQANCGTNSSSTWVGPFTFTTLVNCITPTALSATNITGTTASLNWTSTHTVFNVEYGVSGYTLGSGSAINGVTTNPLNITGLSPTTAYDFYVQSSCGTNHSSSWAGPYTFTTSCSSLVAPFTEDWESVSIDCWTQPTTDSFDWLQYAGATPSLNTGPTADHSGTYYMYIEASYPRVPGEAARLKSVPIDMSALTNPALTFWYHMYGATIGTLNIIIEAPFGSGNYTTIWTLSGDQGEVWQEEVIDLAAYTGQNIGITFEGVIGSSFTGDIAIGDVTVSSGVSCYKPQNVNYTNLTPTSLNLTWTSTAPTVNIEYGSKGFVKGTGIIINGVTNNPFTLSGLTAGMAYDVYIQANCGGSDMSIWTDVITITLPNANGIIIGNGTSTNTVNDASPVNIWYRSLRYQTVYTVAELTAAGATAGEMLQLGWYVESAPLYNLPNYTVRLKHTTATDASTHDSIDLVQVYNNTLYAPTANTFDMLTFQTPFNWDGVSNLLVDVCFEQVNPTYNASGTTRMYNAANGARYIRNDNSNQCGIQTNALQQIKPQVQLVFAPPPPPPPVGDSCLVAWTNVTNAAVKLAGTRLQKNVNTANWDAAAIGQDSLLANEDGWVDMEAFRTNKALVYGLTSYNTIADKSSIRFGIELGTNATAYISENGNRRYTIGSYAIGDIFRIEKANGQVRYYHNRTLVYTSIKVPRGVHYADVSIKSFNGLLYNAYASFGCDNNTLSLSRTSIMTNQPEPLTSRPPLFNDVTAYPNPFEDNVTISYAASIEAVKSIELYHINGQHIRSIAISADGQTTIDTSDLQSGLYLVVINGIKHLKVIKL
jgi:subtilisin family serine protease